MANAPQTERPVPCLAIRGMRTARHAQAPLVPLGGPCSGPGQQDRAHGGAEARSPCSSSFAVAHCGDHTLRWRRSPTVKAGMVNPLVEARCPESHPVCVCVSENEIIMLSPCDDTDKHVTPVVSQPSGSLSRPHSPPWIRMSTRSEPLALLSQQWAFWCPRLPAPLFHALRPSSPSVPSTLQLAGAPCPDPHLAPHSLVCGPLVGPYGPNDYLRCDAS